ncbi:hypothetical protein WISP_148755 [Willisornis vidua]|uniref:Uncharacterized protein n=1 Tax=Willisornis vidua TaxID=1566151 RepID=A0ABQ9CQL4_9PASS|nr:hypothetical protein WISP_148755 [Willisornis vidua]
MSDATRLQIVMARSGLPVQAKLESGSEKTGVSAYLGREEKWSLMTDWLLIRKIESLRLEKTFKIIKSKMGQMDQKLQEQSYHMPKYRDEILINTTPTDKFLKVKHDDYSFLPTCPKI